MIQSPKFQWFRRTRSARAMLRNHRVYDAIPHTMPEESKAHWVWPDDSKAYMGKLCHYVPGLMSLLVHLFRSLGVGQLDFGPWIPSDFLAWNLEQLFLGAHDFGERKSMNIIKTDLNNVHSAGCPRSCVSYIG